MCCAQGNFEMQHKLGCSGRENYNETSAKQNWDKK
jgi:hypothetical protein